MEMIAERSRVTDTTSIPNLRTAPCDGIVITPPFTLRFQLPSYEVYDLEATGLQGLFVKDIKRRLQQVGAVHVLPTRMKFVYKGRALRDQEIIGDLDLHSGDVIHIIIRVVDQEPIYSGYDDFIESSYPKHLGVNVSVHVNIRITLKANSFGHILYTPALADFKALYTMGSGFHRTDILTKNTGNLIPPPHSNLLEHRPYSKTHRWIDLHFSRRVFLLKVEDNLDLNIDQIRYNLLDITKRGYTTPPNGEGDLHSWQRYTKVVPIECDLTISPHEERLPHAVALHPLHPLEYNTTYAILLCNHVPTVPLHYPHDDFDFLSDGVGEDKLVVFKTEKEHELHRRDRHAAVHSPRHHHRRSSRGSSTHHSNHLHSSASPTSSPRRNSHSQHHNTNTTSNHHHDTHHPSALQDHHGNHPPHHHRERIFHPEEFQSTLASPRTQSPRHLHPHHLQRPHSPHSSHHMHSNSSNNPSHTS